MRLLIALVVWVGAITGAVAVSTAVSHSIHKQPTPSARVVSPAASNGPSSAASGAPVDPSSIRASDRASLFWAANFDRALGRARGALGAHARIDNFVVYPGYMSITAVKGGQEVDFYVDASGRMIQTQTGGSPGGTSVFRISQIPPGASAVIARHIATAAHLPQSRLHYLVVDSDPDSANRLDWLMYTVEGTPVEYFETTAPAGRLLEYRTNSSGGLQPVSG